MDYINFNQTGGFPLTQDTMDFLQNAYKNPFGALAKFIGNNALCVIDGCIVTGSAMSSGWIAYNGEILPFQSGTVQATFLVRDLPTNLTYQDGTPHAVVHTRFAQFGVGAGAISWNPIRLTVPLFPALVNSENHIAIGGHSWDKITNTPFVAAFTAHLGYINLNSSFNLSLPSPIPLPYLVMVSIVNISTNTAALKYFDYSIQNKTINSFVLNVQQIDTTASFSSDISADILILKLF
jgi:hypothetical protein